MMAIMAAPTTFHFEPYATLRDLEDACEQMRAAGADGDSVIRVRTKMDMHKFGARVTSVTAVDPEPGESYGRHAA